MSWARLVSQSRRTATSGFTLIELVIVVAIVVIFTGLGFSAFSASQKRAKMTVSQSNMRQLYLANALYAESYNSFLCPFPTSVQNVVAFWAGHDGAYDGTFPARHKEALQPYVKNKDVWFSPGDYVRSGQSNDAAIDFNVDHKISSFIYEAELAADALTAWVKNRPTPTLMSCSIDAPDSTVKSVLIKEPVLQGSKKEFESYWGDKVLRGITRQGNLMTMSSVPQ